VRPNWHDPGRCRIGISPVALFPGPLGLTRQINRRDTADWPFEYRVAYLLEPQDPTSFRAEVRSPSALQGTLSIPCCTLSASRNP